MNKQTLEDLIKFCEQRQLADLAAGLKQDLASLPQGKAPTSSKDLQDRTLQLIRKAIKADDAKKIRDEAVGLGVKRGSAQPNQQHFSFNKEETEEIMEKFMGKVVNKPNLIADDNLNAKIEKIFNVEAFQRMVERADVFQDISSMNASFQSEFMQKQGGFKKVLPTHSQLQDEDEDMEMDGQGVPQFGAQPNPLRDDIN